MIIFWSTSLSGNIGLIGSRLDDDLGSQSGSAYIFRNLDSAIGTTNELVKLLPSDGVQGDSFGQSVSLSGSVGLIGATGDDGAGSGSGAAYVFRNLDSATGTINESVKLLASDGAGGDEFGASVSLSGNTALIGSAGNDDNGSYSGSAYVFRNLDMASGTINESAKLLASDGGSLRGFGESVSLSGTKGLIGAYREGFDGTGPGSAYVFRNLDTVSGTINESVRLLASDGASVDNFARSVSLSGNIGLVGANLDDDNGTNSGSAYVFRNLDTASGTINESVKLLASDGQVVDVFGESVSLSGSVGLIGALRDDDKGSDSGSAYIFRNLDTANGTINESVKILASDGAANDWFGWSVSLDGDRFVVGSLRGNGVVADSGAAYTGTVSSLTTLDFGNHSAIIDGISFQSRTDWVIGETTSNNLLTLSQGDAAEVLEPGAGVYIGANSGANFNSLTISGTIEATDVFVGADGNIGNQLVLDATATNLIDAITLFNGNSLLLEGEYLTFSELDSELSLTDLFVSKDGSMELITAANFDSLLFTSFDNTTGFTSFTAVPEPSSAVFLFGCIMVYGVYRRR